MNVLNNRIESCVIDIEVESEFSELHSLFKILLLPLVSPTTCLHPLLKSNTLHLDCKKPL